MADAAVHGHGEHHDTRGFFTRWFMSTNHKDIGVLYLFTAGIVGLISVCFTVYMRMELQHPGVQYMCLEGARFLPAGDGERNDTQNDSAGLDRLPLDPARVHRVPGPDTSESPEAAAIAAWASVHGIASLASRGVLELVGTDAEELLDQLLPQS